MSGCLKCNPNPRKNKIYDTQPCNEIPYISNAHYLTFVHKLNPSLLLGNILALLVEISSSIMGADLAKEELREVILKK